MEEEIEADVILVHHLVHQYAVEDVILTLALDPPVAVILEEERDLTLAVDVVTLVVEEEVIPAEDEVILVEEATLVDVATHVVKVILEA